MIRRESDVCIIGGGISPVLLAQKLSALRPNLSIRVIQMRERFLDGVKACRGFRDFDKAPRRLPK